MNYLASATRTITVAPVNDAPVVTATASALSYSENQAPAAIDAAGWMHTGDLGTIDEEGYCSIVGRLKDVIIRGGENIAPREVEELLHTHPALADVAVVGVPDGVYGEVVVACVRLRPGASATAEEVREFCKGRISHFKVRRRA